MWVDTMTFTIQTVVILMIISFRTPGYQRTAIIFTKIMNFHGISNLLLKFADLGAARSSSKWIFPSMGLCKYILYILNLVLAKHKPKRLSDTRAQVK